MATHLPLNALPLKVHVMAPATLPAGYTFEAAINGDEAKRVAVEVPEGGVTEGEVFLVDLPSQYVGSRIDAPTGRWKDGLLDCCKFGPFHPSFCCSLCCTPIAMGQVISRMQLTWLGHFGHMDHTSNAFLSILLLVAAFFLYCTALELALLPYTDTPDDIPAYLPSLKLGGNLLFTAWSIYALMRTRQAVRERYQIKEEACKGCEDLCCAVWCGCCATAQMMRHTGEYETYPGICCSATGHPPGTPLVV